MAESGRVASGIVFVILSPPHPFIPSRPHLPVVLPIWLPTAATPIEAALPRPSG